MSSHLEDYLAYYKNCVKPGYAILVTGDWGVGKTFQIMHAIPEVERYYVSLFGLHTTDEVISTVFAAMFPTQAKLRNVLSAAKETTAEVSGIGSLAIGGLVSGIASAFLRQQVKTDRTIIFDDLERCDLGLKEILGVINLYVEHHGCRVIVIAHDDKLAAEFVDAKEKVFGQTIKVEPQIHAAFAKFVSEFVEHSNVAFFEKHIIEIIEIFHASKIESLRVLRHVIEDLARLHKVLSEYHLSNDNAMVELVRLFSALAIEVRRGRLVANDLRDRNGIRISYEIKRLSSKNRDCELSKPMFVVAAEQYSSVDLGSTLLADDVIIKALIHGCFDRDSIRYSLDNSAYFIRPSEDPPWKTFIQFGELDDNVAETAMSELNDQFEHRLVTEPGEILHIFSLRLMMVENGLLEQDYLAVVKSCKLYVDDLLNKERLPPIDLEARFDPFISRGYGGYAYWVSDEYKGYFIELSKYLFDAQRRSLKTKFSGFSNELIGLIEENGDAFADKVCVTRNGIYGSIPVLASIPPLEFVNSWMRSHPRNWYSIREALIERYQAGRLQGELEEEAAWIQEVIIFLESKASEAKGIRKVRIERIIPQSLKADS